MTRSALKIFTSILLRKLFHLLLSLILIIPFTYLFKEFVYSIWSACPDPTLLTLSILLFGASIVNSVQIRLPNIKEKFLKISMDFRKKVIESFEINAMGKAYAELIEGFLTTIIKYEERFLEFISMIERDYEVKYGYICITFGLLSITMSYVLFKNWAVYGIIALAVVDSLSSIITYFTYGRKKIIKHSDISIATTLAVFTLILYLLTQDIFKSIIISLAAVLVELISPEDNLTLPIITSLIAFLLQVNEPII